MSISIIIPTLNEEKRISSVLEQFRNLNDKNFEVIVADGESDDKTMKIAASYGVKVFQNPREEQNIAKNRNLGGKNAKNKILVFCDADTRFADLPKFIRIVEERFKDSNLVAATPKIQTIPEERIWKDYLFMHFLYNSIIRICHFVKKPLSGGQCQIVRKSAFDKINGYDENIIHCEDSDFFLRLRKVGKVRFFSDLIVYESPRRYRKFGYAKVGFDSLRSLINQLVFGKKTFQEWKRVD